MAAIRATKRARTREEAQALAAAAGRQAPLFPEYADDPIGFVTLEMGVRIWRAQREILGAIARGSKVAVRAGQKLSKSNTFVLAALWWTATRPRGRVLFTGPTNDVVRTVLWAELRRLCFAKNGRPDGRRIVDVLGVEPALQPHTGMQWPDAREILGRASDDPNATQGFSGPEVLIIIDEACGVPDPIFEAHDGNTAGGGRILAASNPTESIGWFYEAFHSRREFWTTLHYSSEESPNITGEEPRIPGLAERDWVEKAKAEYGESSPFYLVRVKGEFAGTSSSTVVGLAAVTEAQKRWQERETDPSEPLEYGVDVARFGDDESVIIPRRGTHAFEAIIRRGADGNELAGIILQDVRRRRRSPAEKPVVKIDCTGGYGSSPADILSHHHADEVEVVEVNASSRADDEEMYTNLRAQLHFGVVQWLRDGGELPSDKKLEVELLAPKYGFDARRRIKIESKDDIKKRIRRSPDRADALALSIYQARSTLDDGGMFIGGGRR